ncbi:nucleotidyltransferase domain-containing protein [Candidatus Daviesbacteria bacterium]|nr:nucleotidyltransferase domain-containing protein [Candidatus Daviesbacteria bacterium]
MAGPSAIVFKLYPKLASNASFHPKEAGVTRSVLFGSYVRGEAKEDSDIDILVELPKGLSLFDVAEIKYKADT